MSNNKQTAVEWLLEQLIPEDHYEGIMDIIEDAKQREKEQRFEDFKQGFHSAFQSLEVANKAVQSKTFKSE